MPAIGTKWPMGGRNCAVTDVRWRVIFGSYGRTAASCGTSDVTFGVIAGKFDGMRRAEELTASAAET